MIDLTGRTREVNLSDTETITVASYELYDELFDGNGDFVSKEAEQADSGIFFYVSPDDLAKDHDELVRIINLDAGLESG